MAQVTALVVDHVAVAAADPIGLFDDAVEALGSALEASSVCPTKPPGHQVWMVTAINPVVPDK